ncbi:hypothetical protein OF83DRAFT_1170239 [Amylostereum chailletii]|nr:hypothetical protein OF83DRAFT_1170239 [Amylostereum chailletii]
MSEPRASSSAHRPPSYIPKPAKSSLPSSVNIPTLGLAPSSRQPVAHGSPSQFTPNSSFTASSASSALSGPSPKASGLPSLRSLRSLLPFGSGAQAQPANNSPSHPPSANLPKSSFSGFSNARRSFTVDRKASGTFVRPKHEPAPTDEDDVLVISLDISRQADHTPEENPRQANGFNSVVSLENHGMGVLDSGPPVITYTPDPPLSHELSTIIESDLSGMSRHLPALSSRAGSEEPDSDRAEDGAAHLSPFSFGFSDFLPSNKSPHSPDLQDTSLMDLSTSQLADEVTDALKGKTSGEDWFSRVIVQDAADSRPGSAHSPAEDEEEPSFTITSAPRPVSSFLDLDALDPDLAALLSPNRAQTMHSTLRLPHAPQPSLTPPPPENAIFPHSRPSHQLTTPQPNASTSSYSPQGRSPTSATSSVGSETSPSRPPPVFARPALSRAASSSSMPRVNRPLPGRTSPLRAEHLFQHPIPARAASDPTLPLDNAPPSSPREFDHARRGPSPSRLRDETPGPALQQAFTLDRSTSSRRVPSRLATPARPPLQGSARLMRSTASANGGSPNAWEGDSASPSSRASSSMGTAPTRRPHRPKPSLDDGRRPSLNLERPTLSAYPRMRKRSFSVGEARTARGELLGPSTAKAFAAAGLMEQDGAGAGATGRFGTVRSLGEQRDYRSQYAPSRLAFSEAGSASSWRSGSVSRAMTISEAGPLDTPRTTFSAGSTAPTSVSGASSPQHIQATLQGIHDKHAMETGALLAALADSQRTAQAMREENSALKARVSDLEAQLAGAHAQLQMMPRHHAYPNPHSPHRAHHCPQPSPSLQQQQSYGASSSLGRAIRERIGATREMMGGARERTTRPSTADGPPRRLPSRLSVSPRPSLDMQDRDRDRDVLATSVPASSRSSGMLDTYPSRLGRRPLSGADSVFALPPSNMSLLMHEDEDDMFQFAPQDQTVHEVPKTQVHPPPRTSSPTASNFSATDAGASPKSLFIRPEHEALLGEMPSLELGYGCDEEDEDEDED